MAGGRNLFIITRLGKMLLPILRKRAEETPNELDDVVVSFLEIILDPENSDFLEGVFSSSPDPEKKNKQ